MQSLGVGRSSVREAFQALAIMGLIDIRPGLGTFVREITNEMAIPSNIFAPLINPEGTEDLLEARLAVEPTIASLAAERHTPEEIEEIERVLLGSRDAFTSGKPVYPVATNFHVQIARASHNMVFIRFIETVSGLFAVRGALMEKHKDYLAWEYDSHYSVLRAVGSGDPESARRQMHEHIQEVTRRYVTRND